jgi:hypothetical protein
MEAKFALETQSKILKRKSLSSESTGSLFLLNISVVRWNDFGHSDRERKTREA